MSNAPTDNILFEHIKRAGVDAGNLVIIQDQIYVCSSEDELGPRSVYTPFVCPDRKIQSALLGFLRRLGRTEYPSFEYIENLIAEQEEWETLYSELNALLDRFGVRDGGDFLVVEDNYGGRQHKIECETPGWFRLDMIPLIQEVLVRFPDGWEVIVVGEDARNVPFALSIYKDSFAEREYGS